MVAAPGSAAAPGAHRNSVRPPSFAGSRARWERHRV